MREINLRDANQQFSKLVREIEETGETVLVLRNGKPSIKLMPVEEPKRRMTPEQEAAMAFLRDPKNHFTSPPGWKFDKEAMWDEVVLRHKAVRQLWGVEEPKKTRKRG